MTIGSREAEGHEWAALFTLLDLCMSSLRRGHADLLCIVPTLPEDPRRESETKSDRLHRASPPLPSLGHVSGHPGAAVAEDLELEGHREPGRLRGGRLPMTEILSPELGRDWVITCNESRFTGS